MEAPTKPIWCLMLSMPEMASFCIVVTFVAILSARAEAPLATAIVGLITDESRRASSDGDWETSIDVSSSSPSAPAGEDGAGTADVGAFVGAADGVVEPSRDLRRLLLAAGADGVAVDSGELSTSDAFLLAARRAARELTAGAAST